MPEVVTVGAPVFVNRPVSDGATTKETEITDPVPADGFTHDNVEPLDDKYCPDVPTVERPVPPEN